MLDFGYTSEALINNMEMVGADPKKIEALIVSHGHFDHYGGLLGMLDKYRSALPADLTNLGNISVGSILTQLESMLSVAPACAESP